MKKTIFICMVIVLLCSLALPVFAVTEPTMAADEYEDIIETEEYADIEEPLPEPTEETFPMPTEIPTDPPITEIVGSTVITGPTEYENPLLTIQPAAKSESTTGSVVFSAPDADPTFEDLLLPIGFMGGGLILIVMGIVLLVLLKKKSK